MVFGDGKEIKKLGKPVTVDNDEIANKVLKQKEGAFSEGEIKPFTEEELKTWRWPIRVGLAIAMILIVAWLIYTWPISVKTGAGPPTEVKTADENPVNTVSIGTVIAVPNEWYAMGEVVNFNLEEKLGIKVRMFVGKDGQIEAVQSDYDVLFQTGKVLTVNTKFKIKGESKIYETGTMNLGGGQIGAGSWNKLFDKSIDPSTILWQPEFGTITGSVKQYKEVIVK